VCKKTRECVDAPTRNFSLNHHIEGAMHVMKNERKMSDQISRGGDELVK
jgi:hypothetical protein